MGQLKFAKLCCCAANDDARSGEECIYHGIPQADEEKREGADRQVHHFRAAIVGVRKELYLATAGNYDAMRQLTL